MQAEKQPKKRKSLGCLIQAATLPVGFILLVLAANYYDSIDGPTSRNVGMAMLVGIIMLCIGMWRYGARHLQPGAEELLASDPRAPILYLRSFEAEKSVGDEEMAIARALENVGPVVAIGRPGERLPPLGAARMYFTDDSWQGKVQELLDRALLVIVAAGETPGLGWELSQCARMDDPTKLVILVPSRSDVYERFREIAAGSGLNLPDYIEKKDRRYATSRLAALLTWDPGWQPVYVPLPKTSGRDINFNSPENRGGRAWGAIQQIMRHKGVELPPPPRDLAATYRRIMLMILIPAILFLVLLFAGFGLGYFDPDCHEGDLDRFIERCVNMDGTGF